MGQGGGDGGQGSARAQPLCRFPARAVDPGGGGRALAGRRTLYEGWCGRGRAPAGDRAMDPMADLGLSGDAAVLLRRRVFQRDFLGGDPDQGRNLFRLVRRAAATPDQPGNAAVPGLEPVRADRHGAGGGARRGQDGGAAGADPGVVPGGLPDRFRAGAVQPPGLAALGHGQLLGLGCRGRGG